MLMSPAVTAAQEGPPAQLTEKFFFFFLILLLRGQEASLRRKWEAVRETREKTPWDTSRHRFIEPPLDGQDPSTSSAILQPIINE